MYQNKRYTVKSRFYSARGKKSERRGVEIPRSKFASRVICIAYLRAAEWRGMRRRDASSSVFMHIHGSVDDGLTSGAEVTSLDCWNYGRTFLFPSIQIAELMGNSQSASNFFHSLTYLWIGELFVAWLVDSHCAARFFFKNSNVWIVVLRVFRASIYVFWRNVFTMTDERL